jgi:coenzyme F420-reducing hydrogenase delta subunit
MDTPPQVPGQHKPRVLVVTTALCSYIGLDTVGQMRIEYPANYYAIRTLAPVIFPEDFYLDCFRKGIDGIILASCGTDCPYEGAYAQTAARIDRVYKRMRERGLDPRRLRLTAICSVCTRAFLREVDQMNQVLAELGPVEGADSVHE